MLSLRPVLISQRINRARATEKKKFYRVATRIGIFPPRAPSPSSRKSGSGRGSTRTMASTIPLLDSSPIISKCRSSFSPIFSCSRAESRSLPSLAGEDFSWRGKGRRRMRRSGDDKSTPDNRVAFCEARSFPIQRENGLDLGRFNDVVILPSRLS